MGTLNKIGRVLFSIPFLVLGINHFIQGQNLVGAVPLPAPIIWVYIAGIGLVLAAITILTTYQIKLAMILLAIELLIFVFAIHLRGLLAAGLPAGMGSLISMVKDTGLAGGALILSALYGQKQKNEIIK